MTSQTASHESPRTHARDRTLRGCHRQLRRADPRARQRRLQAGLVADQTSAHDPLNGYIPAGLTLEEADALREGDPEGYVVRSKASMRTRQGDVGLSGPRRPRLRLRQQHSRHGDRCWLRARDFRFRPCIHPSPVLRRQGAVPLVCALRDPEDIYTTDRALLELFPRTRRCETGSKWPRNALSSRAALPHLLAGIRRAREGRSDV